MSSSARRVSFYLEGAGAPVFCTRHEPAAPAAGASVLICPPFGWEEVCAYRSLRVWADRLAGGGHEALRLSLPSTGDSAGGPGDPGQVQAWVAAVSDAAGWLAARAPERRVVTVGIGLGGMLAMLAAAAGAPIDDLVLWGVPARGRSLLRPLRAFAKLEQELFFEGLPSPPPLPEGELEAGGFRLSAETVTTLEQLDLRTFELPAGSTRRVLLLQRDGVAPDAALVESLERSGLDVEIAPGDGFGEMTSHPQLARAPDAVIDRVAAWLADAAPASTLQAAAVAAEASAVAVLGPGGVPVRETVLAIPGPSGQLSAILTEPLEPEGAELAVVLLNAGAVRRIGPNRTWVEAARRWAASGVPSLRLDVEGIGDADGAEELYRQDASLYELRFVTQVRTALDELERRGTATRFMLCGLCASAYWAFQCAREDSRVAAAIFLNLRAIVWNRDLAPARDLRALFTQAPSLARMRRAVTRERLREFLRWLLRSPMRLLPGFGRGESRAATATAGAADVQLRALLDSGRRLSFVFSEHEPLFEELERSGQLRWVREAPGATLERIAVRDHTMRPLWAQGELHAALDRALAREPRS